jgi:hypothetical protein
MQAKIHVISTATALDIKVIQFTAKVNATTVLSCVFFYNYTLALIRDPCGGGREGRRTDLIHAGFEHGLKR